MGRADRPTLPSHLRAAAAAGEAAAALSDVKTLACGRPSRRARPPLLQPQHQWNHYVDLLTLI